MPAAIGIDLGTVYSCVGVFLNGTVEIIANSQGHRVTPSVVAFNERGKLTGDAAKNQIGLNPGNTIYDAKRMIGRRFKDISDYDKQRWPFEIVNEDGFPMFEIPGVNRTKILSPEEISAEVLKEMKETAEDFLGEEVTDAVITIPAYFNDSQRQATKDAAEIAGLNVLRLINEPTAAAIAYGLDAKVDSDQNILVFDMGGGTFDVSILAIDGDVYEVKAVGGDVHLGGEDFNNKLLDHFMAELSQKHKIDISDDKIAMSRLLKQCEVAKITLSTAQVAEVRVNPLVGSFDFKSSITRARFEELMADFFDKAIAIVEDTIEQSKLQKTEINEVVLVGGSTYIPKVQEMLKKCFNGKTLNKSIKPDEAVAYGAAVQASILAGTNANVDDFLLIDVTPHSLGLEYGGEFFHKIINRNTPIPLEVTSYRFSTSRNNQTEVAIKIYEGEEILTCANNLLGRFHLKDLPEAPAKKLRIAVKFKIDADGILEVTAEESSSGVKKSIQVDRSNAPDPTFKILTATERAEAEAKLQLYKQMSNLSVIEEKVQSVHFQNGMDYFESGEFDAAFDCFTEALKIDRKNVNAMKYRALIHFERSEFEECEVECDEILKISKLPDIVALQKKAIQKISPIKSWFEIIGVASSASKNAVKKAYKMLAKQFSTNNSKHSKLLAADKKKLDLKMAKVNGAKSEWEKKFGH